MIGIQISTRNRPEVLDYTLAKFSQFYDENQMIIVIDDGSQCAEKNKEITMKYGFVYYLNESRLGIPRTKERGYYLMKGCDFQFWFDDDCFPRVEDWYKVFIERMEYQPHLLHLKEWAHIRQKQVYKEGVTSYTGATACLMTFTRECYPQIDGFAKDYLKYGHWHSRLSQKFAVIDEYVAVSSSSYFIHAFDVDGVPPDFKGKFASCMTVSERTEELRKWKPV